MSGVPRESVVLDIIRRALPDGTNGNASWRTACIWPPDLFAAMAVVAERTGLYAEPIFTSYWVAGFVPTEEWIEETRKVGRRWAKVGKPPKLVQDCWRNLMRRVATTPGDADLEVCKLVFQLLCIADEACAGIGFQFPLSKPNEVRRGRRATQNQDRISGIQFLVYEEYRTWSEEYKENREIVGGAILPYLPVSLCRWVPPEVYSVQPKTSTPTVGCNLRALTHHLALVPTHSSVETRWHIEHERVEELHAFNILAVPFPYHIPGSSFRPLSGSFPGDSKDRAFNLDPNVWLRGAEPRAFAEFLDGLIQAAKPELEPVHAIVLPEAALPLHFADEVASILKTRGLDLFVTGVITNSGELTRNSAAIYRFVNGALIDHVFQKKHHRWGLNDDQIRRYHLGHVLDPGYKWWEQIDVADRECHVILFRAHASLSVLICEDLARYDPVLTVMNAIGPNLVIALLMDGPQLEHRWPGRYATVLADDPGSAVLTLTSLGMVARSSMPADPQNREIALWKEPTGKARSLRLPKGDHALLLTLTSRLVEQFTLDGRGDGGATVHFGLGAAHPVRYPQKPPDWLGPVP
jgi:hypothetical protein